MPGPRGGHPQDFDINISNKPNLYLPWSAVCCYLTGHKQCKHQHFQRPGSPWIHVEPGIQRGFGNVVCSCNSVICTVKYTHLCIRHGVQTSLNAKEDLWKFNYFSVQKHNLQKILEKKFSCAYEWLHLSNGQMYILCLGDLSNAKKKTLHQVLQLAHVVMFKLQKVSCFSFVNQIKT